MIKCRECGLPHRIQVFYDRPFCLRCGRRLSTVGTAVKLENEVNA